MSPLQAVKRPPNNMWKTCLCRHCQGQIGKISLDVLFTWRFGFKHRMFELCFCSERVWRCPQWVSKLVRSQPRDEDLGHRDGSAIQMEDELTA